MKIHRYLYSHANGLSLSIYSSCATQFLVCSVVHNNNSFLVFLDWSRESGIIRNLNSSMWNI